MTLTPVTFSKCLADTTRAQIALLILQERELCVCELTYALNESQPKISRHLAQLRTAGLLSDHRKGQWVYYQLHPDLPLWVKQVLKTMLKSHDTWLADVNFRLSSMQNRPYLCC